MDRGLKSLRWLQKAVLAAFVLALVAGIFQPVYTDEVGWRFQERAALDGVDKLFSDLCGPNTLAAPPFFMMPVRYYSAFFNTMFADPFYVRLSGVFYALVWFVLLLTLVRRIAEKVKDRVVLSTIGIGLLCLGVQPLLMIWSRPEQPILLAATSALVLTWSGGRDLSSEASARSAWIRSLAIVLLAMFAFSYHLKAIFLTPVFMACLFFASRGRQANLPRLAMGAVLLVAAGWSAHYWINRMQCPNDPLLMAAYGHNNFGMELTNSRSAGELLSALGRMFGNISLLFYFGLPIPRVDPLSNWLEPGLVSRSVSFVWFRLLIIAWFGALIVALACLYVKARDAWRQRKLDARLTMALVLLVTVLGWSATQAIRNVYEAILALPLVMLAILFAISTRPESRRIDTLVRVLTVIVGFSALISTAMVAWIYGPSLARASQEKGYLHAQPLSLSVFGYADLKPDILGAAQQCGMGNPAKANAVMVDDLTYFAFMESRLPQHHLGVVGLWRGTIDDPMAYLRSRGSSGAIVDCRVLPDDLRERAKSQGRFCCLGPPNW